MDRERLKRSVKIPDSVTEFGRYIFHKCTSLQSISISDDVLKLAEEKDIFTRRLKGAIIAISGKFEFPMDRKELTAWVEDFGGTVKTGVSSKTTCLIADDPDSQSSNVVKARQLGIRIYSQEEFMEHYFNVKYS